MSPTEQHQLAEELAVWIAKQVRRFGAFTTSANGPLLNSATSPFAGACYTLWGLGSATTTDENGNPPDENRHLPPSHFRVADEADVRLALAGHRITPKDFSRLIGDFVGLREYSPEAFELTAESFRPSLPRPLLDGLVAAGFLECVGDRCRWTDVMTQWIEWSSPRHLWESKAESEARHLSKYGPIWTTMPAWIKAKVVEDGELNRLMLVDGICRFWDGEWHSEQVPDWQDQKRLINAMEIADQIQRLLEAERLSIPRPNSFWGFFADLGRRGKR